MTDEELAELGGLLDKVKSNYASYKKAWNPADGDFVAFIKSKLDLYDSEMARRSKPAQEQPGAGVGARHPEEMQAADDVIAARKAEESTEFQTPDGSRLSYEQARRQNLADRTVGREPSAVPLDPDAVAQRDRMAGEGIQSGSASGLPGLVDEPEVSATTPFSWHGSTVFKEPSIEEIKAFRAELGQGGSDLSDAVLADLMWKREAQKAKREGYGVFREAAADPGYMESLGRHARNAAGALTSGLFGFADTALLGAPTAALRALPESASPFDSRATGTRALAPNQTAETVGAVVGAFSPAKLTQNLGTGIGALGSLVGSAVPAVASHIPGLARGVALAEKAAPEVVRSGMSAGSQAARAATRAGLEATGGAISGVAGGEIMDAATGQDRNSVALNAGLGMGLGALGGLAGAYLPVSAYKSRSEIGNRGFPQEVELAAERGIQINPYGVKETPEMSLIRTQSGGESGNPQEFLAAQATDPILAQLNVEQAASKKAYLDELERVSAAAGPQMHPELAAARLDRALKMSGDPNTAGRLGDRTDLYDAIGEYSSTLEGPNRESPTELAERLASGAPTPQVTSHPPTKTQRVMSLDELGPDMSSVVLGSYGGNIPAASNIQEYNAALAKLEAQDPALAAEFKRSIAARLTPKSTDFSTFEALERGKRERAMVAGKSADALDEQMSYQARQAYQAPDVPVYYKQLGTERVPVTGGAAVKARGEADLLEAQNQRDALGLAPTQELRAAPSIDQLAPLSPNLTPDQRKAAVARIGRYGGAQSTEYADSVMAALAPEAGVGSTLERIHDFNRSESLRKSYEGQMRLRKSGGNAAVSAFFKLTGNPYPYIRSLGQAADSGAWKSATLSMRDNPTRLPMAISVSGGSDAILSAVRQAQQQAASTASGISGQFRSQSPIINQTIIQSGEEAEDYTE